MAENQYTNEPTSLDIELIFNGTPPTALLMSTIQVCEDEINQIQRAEMDSALDTLDVPGYVKSVCRRRFFDAQGMGLRFVDSKRGSIVLIASLTALGYWIIQNTVGETMKEAYKESGMHDRLKRLFLTRLGRQTKDLESALTGRLVRLTQDTPTHVSIRVEHRDHRFVVSVSVTISSEREQTLPPTIEVWLRSKD